jgi:hypothetical protein
LDLGIRSGYLHREGSLEKRNRRWGPLAGDGDDAPLCMRERVLGAVRLGCVEPSTRWDARAERAGWAEQAVGPREQRGKRVGHDWEGELAWG